MISTTLPPPPAPSSFPRLWTEGESLGLWERGLPRPDHLLKLDSFVHSVLTLSVTLLGLPEKIPQIGWLKLRNLFSQL